MDWLLVVQAVEEAGGPSRKCIVVPYAADTSRFRPGARRGQGTLRVLYAGSVQLLKGVQYLTEAARVLRSEGIQFRAVGPVGLGPKGVAAIREVVELSGPVSRTRMQAVYDWADVLVFPSEWEEPFGLAHLEAMACGCTVVSTTTGGSAELIRDGENALAFGAGEAEALSGCLSRLADDEKPRRASSVPRRNAGERVTASAAKRQRPG